MKKLKYIISSIWLIIMAVISPICIASVYLDLTGHSKGFGYDLGAEKDISVFFGIMELILWIISVFPVMIWLCSKLKNKKEIIGLFPVITFLVIGCVVISMIGWNEYIKCFGYQL